MSKLELVATILTVVTVVLMFVRPHLGMVAIAVVYPFHVFAPRSPVPGLNAETVIIGLALGLTLMRFGLRIPPPRYSMPVIAFVLVIVGAWLVSSASIQNVRLGFTTWTIFKVVKSLVLTTSLFFVGYWWFVERWERRRLLETISFSTGIAAITGLVDFVAPFTQSSIVSDRAAGVFGNPNSLAEMTAVFSVVPLYLLRDPDVPRFRRFLHLGVYGICWTAVIISLSRGNWLAMLVGQAAWFLLINRQLLAVGFVAIVLAGTIAFPLLPSMVQDRVERTTDLRGGSVYIQGLGTFEGSAAFRIIMYRVGLDMWWASPIWGHGLESVRLLGPQFGAKYGLLKRKSPHSLPLKMGAETGLIGLFVLGWLVLSILLTSRNLWYERDGDHELGAMLFAIGMCLGASNLFHTGFLLNHSMSAFFWLIYGTCVRRYMVGDTEEEDEYEQEALEAMAPRPVTVPALARTYRPV